MKITVETRVRADPATVWECWTSPEGIVRWNSASDDWHTTRSTVDLREGGRFLSRMEARNGSAGFDFEGTYTRIVPHELIEYRMDDGREVTVEFLRRPEGVTVRTVFDAEGEHSAEMQHAGWQAISDNFGRYVELKG
ncbi:MAG: SRPBCC family protein [Longimicrobiales bacterium]|nr:SRPBCC family protein [Longimicrobiales bacterium]